MENRTQAISSAAANFQLVSNRLGSRMADRKVKTNTAKDDSISDSLETSDSQSPDGSAVDGRKNLDDEEQSPGTDSRESGSILDISG